MASRPSARTASSRAARASASSSPTPKSFMHVSRSSRALSTRATLSSRGRAALAVPARARAAARVQGRRTRCSIRASTTSRSTAAAQPMAPATVSLARSVGRAGEDRTRLVARGGQRAKAASCSTRPSGASARTTSVACLPAASLAARPARPTYSARVLRRRRHPQRRRRTAPRTPRLSLTDRPQALWPCPRA